MTKEEVKKILGILKLNYPNSFKNQSKDVSHAYFNLWCEAFQDDDAALVAKAVKAIIFSSEREFAPNIGQVKAMMYKLTNPTKMSEEEAWRLVMQASKNGIYNSKQEFDKLPKAIQRVLGSPETLQEYATIDIEQLNTVVSSNFRRSYRAVSKELEDYDRLPNQIKGFISSITDSKRLIDDEDTKKLEVSYEVIRTIPKY